MPLTKTNSGNNLKGGLSLIDSGLSDMKGLKYKTQSSTSLSNLDSVEGLLKLAQEKGLLDQATEKIDENKLSFLERLVSGAGALNPAEAIMRAQAGENFLLAYPTTVIQGVASALTGNDIGEQTKRRYFSDLVESMGMENKVARFGIGLVGDILLDPSTYVGGTLVRYGIKGAGKAGGLAMTAIEKASPLAAKDLRIAGTAIKDATGELFVHGYGATKGLSDDMLTYIGEKSSIIKGIARSNMNRLGTGVLNEAQAEEFVGKMLSGKNAEFNFFDDVEKEMIAIFNKKFPNARFPLEDAAGAARRIENLAASTSKKVSNLQNLRQKLAQPLMAEDLLGLKTVVAELRKELDSLIPKKEVAKASKKPFMANADQMDASLLSALSHEKQKYNQMIVNLQAQIDGIMSGVVEPAMKQVAKEVGKESVRYNADDIIKMAMRKLDPKLSIRDKIAELDQQVLKVQNDMFAKQQVLESVLGAKSIAKERIKTAFSSGNFDNLPEELALALRPVSDDPVVQQALTEQIARNANTARKAHIEDPFQVYFPSLAKDNLQGFLQRTRNLKIGSEGYKKEYRALLKDNELLRNPAEAYFKVESEIAVNNYTRAVMEDMVEKYGKPLTEFASEKEAAAAGYKVWKEKGMFGKEIGYLNEKDWKFINGQIGNQFGAIDALAKATGFDAATSLFKRFVTGIFAPFHVRNWTSGKIQNYEMIGKEALYPKTIATGTRIANKISKGAFIGVKGQTVSGKVAVTGKAAAKLKSFGDETVELGGKTWFLDDIAKAINKRFGGSSHYSADFNSITSDADILEDAAAFSKEGMKEFGKKLVNVKKPVISQISALTSQKSPHFKAAQAIGGFIELQQKSEAVVAALTKGHDLETALKLAERAGFDYRALTPFESHIMRRIIPFYSFTRKNIELQLRTLGQNPQRINHVIRSIDNLRNVMENQLTDEERENLPAYLKDYLSVPVGRVKPGVLDFVYTFGTPIEAFTQLIRSSAEGKSSIERTFMSTISQVNPIFKVPIELGMGKDSFRMRDLNEVYTAPEYAKAPEFLKDFLRIKEVTKKDASGNPRTVYVADPERLLFVRSLFTSRGFTYFNNVFNGDVKGFFKIIDLTTGLNVNEVDTIRQEGYTERQKEEVLGDLLRRYGIVSEFNKLYIPKNK